MKLTPADFRNLQQRAKKGDVRAAAALQGALGEGVPIIGQQVRPIPKENRVLLKCPCGGELFETIERMRCFKDKTAPDRVGGEISKFNRCARCKCWMKVEVKNGEAHTSFADIELGLTQFNTVLMSEKQRWLSQVAEVLDKHFGKDREEEADQLANKIIDVVMPQEERKALARKAEEEASEEKEDSKPEGKPPSNIITEV